MSISKPRGKQNREALMNLTLEEKKQFEDRLNSALGATPQKCGSINKYNNKTSNCKPGGSTKETADCRLRMLKFLGFSTTHFIIKPKLTHVKNKMPRKLQWN